MRIRSFMTLMLAVAGLTTLMAADTHSQIDKFNLGTYWYGAKIDKKDLMGKVVVYEIWGKN